MSNEGLINQRICRLAILSSTIKTIVRWTIQITVSDTTYCGIFHMIRCMILHMICCMSFLSISLSKCGSNAMANKWFVKWFRNWNDVWNENDPMNDSMSDSKNNINDSIRSSRLQMLFKVGAFKYLVIFKEKHLFWNLFLIKLQAWRLQQRCFRMNIAKFLRTALFIEHLQWLLLFYEWFNKWLHAPFDKHLQQLLRKN